MSNVVKHPAVGNYDWHNYAINAQELCDKQFPPLKYLFHKLIPEGVTLLVSRPKIGKSWFLQQAGTSVALGMGTLSIPDYVKPTHGDVLHLTLEDGERRFKRRMEKYFNDDRNNWPSRMTIMRQWRRLDNGGLDDLYEWCNEVKEPTLISIDTLKKVRPAPKSGKATNYDIDYESCEGLIKLSHDVPGLSILVAHHDRKMDADDPFDTVSGTLGLTGGVDAIAMFKRSRNGIALYIQGRDLEDPIEKAVRLDRETGRWEILGEAIELGESTDRKRVKEALRSAIPNGLSVAEIMSRCFFKTRNAADLLLGKMVDDGSVLRVKRGVYALAEPVM